MSGPDVWGPHGWKFIHYVTLGYPDNPTEQQKKNYKDFLISLKNVIPCSICANHYAENLNKVPLTDEVMRNRENLIKWGIEIHNVVNESKNKPRIDYHLARELIEDDTKCKQKRGSNMRYCQILFILVISFFVYKYLNKNNKNMNYRL